MPAERLSFADTLQRLWWLSRPGFALYLLLLVFAGFGWAHWDRALTGRGGWGLLWVMAAWWFLSAGTLWLNAAVDKDEGEVLMGRSVTPPPHTMAWAYGALAVSVPFAAQGGWVAGLCCAVSAVLAVLYSHPSTFWKSHPLGGPFVNLVGYGLLSPLAGWSVVGVGLNSRTLAVWLIGGVGILGCYFAAQAFQGDEDRERGYRTFVVTHGPRATIGAARICVLLAVAGGTVLIAVGWIPRACLVVVPMGLWIDRHFVAWLEEPNGGSESHAREMARRLLWTGLAGLVTAFAWYGVQSFQGVPVAGLGTVAGHPADRPLLPPHAMRAWEAWRAREQVPQVRETQSEATRP